jgi:histone-lysine N-methyltransferase SETMAR
MGTYTLNEDQKSLRLNIFKSNLLLNNTASFLKRIITCDEKWILYDNREPEGEWMNKGDDPKPFAKPDLHPKKIMVSVWWNVDGLIHYSTLKQGETIDFKKYCSDIKKMYMKYAAKYPRIVNMSRLYLLHDNARPHTAQLTKDLLESLKVDVLPHPPYSPNLSPTEYHFFKHLHIYLRGRTFREKEQVRRVLKSFVASRNPNFF